MSEHTPMVISTGDVRCSACKHLWPCPTANHPSQAGQLQPPIWCDSRSQPGKSIMHTTDLQLLLRMSQKDAETVDTLRNYLDHATAAGHRTVPVAWLYKLIEGQQ